MKYKFYVKKVTKRESSFSSRYDLNKDMYLICIEDEKEFNNLIELLSYLEEQTLKLTGVHQPVYQVRYYDEILHRYQYAELLFDSRLFNIQTIMKKVFYMMFKMKYIKNILLLFYQLLSTIK